jgi:hypothetical protein
MSVEEWKILIYILAAFAWGLALFLFVLLFRR